MPLYITVDNRFEAKQREREKKQLKKNYKSKCPVCKNTMKIICFIQSRVKLFKKEKRSRTTLTLPGINLSEIKLKKKQTKNQAKIKLKFLKRQQS